jgi:cytochrome c biogenesis protein CcmG, thiol:disulfide interchange protein DsbE
VTGRRQLIIVLGVLGLLAAAFFAVRRTLGDELSPVGVGVEAPQFSAVTIDLVPRVKSLADYKGHVVMLNIWATWCLPCRVEMPSIEQLHKVYGPRGLDIIGVSVDEPHTEPEIRDFVKQYGLTFQILHDTAGQDGVVSRAYNATGYPETVIIGRDGLIRKQQIGASDWNSPLNRGLVERLLAGKAE